LEGCLFRDEKKEVALQRGYYAETAEEYDTQHVQEDSGNARALQLLVGFLAGHPDIKSVLDIGAGTGRVARDLRERFPHIRFVSVEPSQALRDVAHQCGLSSEEIVDGDAQNLAFSDASFDVVCEFGALHHIPRPDQAVGEMLRVAKHAIFISDCNNFGQGRPLVRWAKRFLRRLGLWGLADYIKTRGKGYTITEGDGLAYSYSVFNDYAQIQRCCTDVLIMNTGGQAVDMYRHASHIAVLGIISGEVTVGASSVVPG